MYYLDITYILSTARILTAVYNPAHGASCVYPDQPVFGVNLGYGHYIFTGVGTDGAWGRSTILQCSAKMIWNNMLYMPSIVLRFN